MRSSHLFNAATGKPRVSVVIPVRNGKDYLQEALDSVLQQSFTDLELLLINDGSTDDDYDRYALQDQRIRVIHLTGTGVSRARNVGMAQSRGELIAFLDADDLWFPGKLQAQVRYFDDHPDVGVVFGKFIRWPALLGGGFAPASSLIQDASRFTTAEPERSGWLYARLLKGLLVGMNTAVIRRGVYEAIGGFDESMRQGEDYDFWLKSSRISEMHSLNGPVALYRIHGASAMHKLSDENHLANLIKVATLRWSASYRPSEDITNHEIKRRLGEAHFTHGYAHYWSGSKLIAKKSFSKALSSGYKKTRSLAYLILCSTATILKPQHQKK
ncbi:glycosyl transferase family 2 [Acidovorax carolinensis]|uniref:Glycosyl transferase family 2 n=1 Tax=Acidovorax carolinensis TaxID=553814 RepID=A0A240UH16_9BURK|nr:glycosyltransferase family A protein [Acidovorax carolinensis]ART54021.1 glycosyl transferase family 2 [Acidovorax carolinensis]ART60363.1 glycosyl transferase family 2 [Acidovorax carolinensis]